MQCRISLGILMIDRRSPSNQHFQYTFVAILSGDQQQRVALGVLGVDRETLYDKDDAELMKEQQNKAIP
jgi:hypothetical protein